MRECLSIIAILVFLSSGTALVAAQSQSSTNDAELTLATAMSCEIVNDEHGRDDTRVSAAGFGAAISCDWCENDYYDCLDSCGGDTWCNRQCRIEYKLCIQSCDIIP